METNQVTPKDRREFYRVSCSAAIEIEEFNPQTQCVADIFSLPAEYAMVNEFRALSSESSSTLQQIMDTDKNIGVYLKNLNKKVELLATAITSRLIVLDSKHIQEIDISEGGIHFCWPTPLNENSHIATKLTLLPDSITLLLVASVKSCHEQLNESKSKAEYLINVEFEAIDCNAQTLISRFITQQQRRELNQLKNSE